MFYIAADCPVTIFKLAGDVLLSVAVGLADLQLATGMTAGGKIRGICNYLYVGSPRAAS